MPVNRPRTLDTEENVQGQLITDEDLQIFQAGKTDLNYLTDFYLRGPRSGTFWRRFPAPPDPEREAVWKALYKEWRAQGKPDPVFAYTGVVYNIQWDDDGAPVFWHHHGWLAMPWQKQAYHDPRPEQTIVGGMGCLDWNARIWNEDTQQYEAIGALCEAQRAPTVLAWNGQALVPAKATVPFKKGRDHLYTVTTASGRRITATGHHRFLTPQGYKMLSDLACGDWLLGCDTVVMRSGISPDQIVSISYVGERDYYDLHVPIYENYVAEGLVSHNSGKTAYIAVSLACMAMTIPHFRGFNFAPQMVQAQEVYSYIKNHFMDTPFWERFVVASPLRPYPRITVKNSFVGESTIEIYSIEKDTEKIRTIEGDVAFVDQGEKFDNLDDVVRDIGSRLRGQVANRPRVGRLCIVANAGDNPQLWTRYDQGEYQPKYFMSLNPSSYDNIYLTDVDRDNLKRRVSSDASADEIDQWMHGRRPLGKGEHFPGYQVKAATDEGLDRIMIERIEAGDPGYVRLESPPLHIYRWEMPPDFAGKRVYCTIGDPGQGNPPDRNSAPIMVWDITDFPKAPAVMRAFYWVAGNGSIMPFFQEMLRLNDIYQTKDRCAFDSTGTQKGQNELAFANFGIMAEPMDMAVNGKMFAINSLKMFLGRGLIKFPYIAHLGNQLTNYRIPDNKIRQDLVMCIAMSASYIRRYFYYDAVAADEEEQARVRSSVFTTDRYHRNPYDRYYRGSGRPR